MTFVVDPSQPAMTTAPPVAERLQRYQIMESIGRGGQGQTYRAIDRLTNATVAVKVLSLRGQPDWKRFDLFEREIAVLRSLSHPGLPTYVDHYASESTGDYFLVMTFIDGTSLAERIRNARPMGVAELTQLFVQALDILEYLHGMVPAVIHRDIKPANLVLRHDGRLALVDFGGVRVAMAEEGGGSTMIGTFGYMAPEQLHGEAGPATDLYALGATWVALAAAKEADRLPRRGLVIDVEAVVPASPLRDTLQRLLVLDPRERPQSAREVKALLQRRALPPGEDVRSDGYAGTRSGSTGEAEPGEALMHIPEAVQALAKAPAPFSFLLWMFSVFMTGLLGIVEAVFIPLAYRLSEVFDGEDGSKVRRTKQERDAKLAVGDARRTFQYLADRTQPGSDGDGEGKPSTRKR